MKLRSAGMSIVLLAMITTVLAQEPSPASTGPGTPVSSQRRLPARRWGTPPADNKTAGVQNPGSFRQQLQDMEATVTSMHAVLKEMQAKAAASRSKDPLVKTNLAMWELMVGHLDKQLHELQVAEAARKDLEDRRAAMYKQAEAKAEAAARAAQAAQSSSTGQSSTPSTGVHSVEQGAGEKIPSGQSPTPTTSDSPSPK